MGRYVSQPLIVKCGSIHNMRQFLASCKYVSDKDLFDKGEYWQPPEEFEQRKKGDREDFAFWIWRQLFEMGYDVRVVFGRHGR
jgi:predicted transglutaminase-like cysteine proteinase